MMLADSPHAAYLQREGPDSVKTEGSNNNAHDELLDTSCSLTGSRRWKNTSKQTVKRAIVYIIIIVIAIHAA